MKRAENNCDPVPAPGKRMLRWKIGKPKRNLNFYYRESNRRRRQQKLYELPTPVELRSREFLYRGRRRGGEIME